MFGGLSTVEASMRKATVVSLAVVLAVIFLVSEAMAGDGEARQIPLYVDSGQMLGDALSDGIAVGDLDGDDDNDAFVANSGTNTVYLNDGSGRFSDSDQLLGDSLSTAVVLGDLDDDGDLDAFVGNRGSFYGAADRVWLNDGSGVFTVTDQSIDALISYAVALGDVDEDTDLDAFVASCGPGYTSAEFNKLWLNDGQAFFADSGQDFGMLCSSDAAMGDVNGDGNLDIVVANAGSPNPPTSSFGVEIWVNDGSGTFTMTQRLDRTYNFGVDLGDLDADGDLDIFVANGDALGGVSPNLVWINDGSGTFEDSGQRLGSFASNAIALSDVDLDGDLDAFVANDAGQPNKVWLNDGFGAFVDSGEDLGSALSEDLALVDVEGDMDVDAFVANSGANKVWFNTSTRYNMYFPVIKH